jgi:hypothetical protein
MAVFLFDLCFREYIIAETSIVKQLQKENLMYKVILIVLVILVVGGLYLGSISPCNNSQQHTPRDWSLNLDQDVQLIFNHPCQAYVSNASERTYRYRVFEESEGIISGLTEKTIRMETVLPGSRSRPFVCNYNKFELLNDSNDQVTVLDLNVTWRALYYR